MRSQLLPLFKNEVAKAVRRKLPFFGLFAIALVCVIIYFVAGELNNASTANGWGYVGFSMQLVFTDIGPICVLAFAAMLISEETGTGTIRASFAAPVYRWEWYLAKAAVGLAYTLILALAALGFSAVLACLHYHFAAISDSMGVVYPRSRAAHELLLAFALCAVPLAALTMYGLLISTFIRSPGAAVAVGISSVFLIDFTKHLVGLDPYIFTRYLGYSWLTLQQMAQGMDYQWRPEVWRMLELCGGSALFMFVVGMITFVRQDLNH